MKPGSRAVGCEGESPCGVATSPAFPEEVMRMAELGMHATGSKKRKVREYAEAFAVALVIALVVRTLFLQAFKIPAGCMENTFLDGDHIIVNKFLYG